jgi:hypothetical protein
MKNDLVCQLHFDHKILVSVIITRRNVECFLRPLVCCFQEVSKPDEPEIVTSSGECWEMFMAAIFAFHTGKAVVQIAVP